MKRFFERIAEKARDVSQSPIITVAFGDSVTQGVMEHNFLDSRHVYHRVLQSSLEDFFPNTTFSTINAGVSGGGLPQALERLDRDVIAYQPDLVLIAFGLNDSLMGEAGLSSFGEGLSSIVHRIREQSSADIILLTPPFMARKPSHRIHPEHLPMTDKILETQNSGMLGRYADEVRRVASQYQVPLADIHKEWQRLARCDLDTDLWLINGLNHPDQRGHRLAAASIFHLLLKHRRPL
ncbi:lysophospholiPASe L1 [Terrimicrobium sacchariphilum]|uniref:LysophospholiPASe L1 n=1 Tax=Terrimicrobium sacchariphilum TaxID=690879 RepID=A0A146GAS9_TERSA|nr:SGNH/GDSL hydrolase family protein [Terrimicrobium sacchariphilum]GAT34715.1 lysophospholiPASe L1 [Terrimicrobium sacchariphilum]